MEIGWRCGKFISMQFLIIMGIGSLAAIWVVANQPKTRGHRKCARGQEIEPFVHKPGQTLAIAKDIAESVSIDEIDYMCKSARYEDDPQHWPAPLPPPPKKAEF